jgi:hypothetical protein
MVKTAQETGKEIVEKLREGKMLSQPTVAFHIKRATLTGDYAPLIKFLQDHPIIMAQAEANIAFIKSEQAINPFRPYPSREDSAKYLSGPHILGYINLFGNRFGIDDPVLYKIAIILGRPDSGKSILAKYLLCQLLLKPRDYNVIIPDLKKEYRHLGTICKRLKILTKDKIKINPLQVLAGTDPRDHIPAFAKTFVSENYLVGTSENLLIELLEYLYRERGVFDGSENYPTLRDLYRLLSARLRMEKSYKFNDVLLWLKNRLYHYTILENFDCRTGIPFDTFRTENLALEMDEGFNERMYNFVVATILHQLYLYNKKRDLTGKLRQLMVVDEARILFQASREKSIFGESIINEDVTKCRAFGIGFLILTQETASINQVLRSLAYLKIAFPLNDEMDLEFIENSFGLSKEQRNSLFSLPPQARAVVRYGGYENPFLLQVPNFNIKRHLTDQDVKERMAEFWAKLDQEIKRPERPKPAEISAEGAEQPQAETQVPPACVALLFYLSKYPFTKSSELIKAPGFKSVAEVNKALDWLNKNQFIAFEAHRVSRGRKSLFSVLQDKARKYLEVESLPGKGNFEHKLYQNLIYEKLLKEGLKTKIEGKVKGGTKVIDVLASTEEGLVAYEVTLHFENLLTNIQKDLADGVSKVVIVTRNAEDLEKAQNILQEDQTGLEAEKRVENVTIDEFFD